MQTSSTPNTDTTLPKRRRILGGLALLSLAAQALAGRATAAAATTPASLVAAQQAYYQGQYGHSLVLFERLAAQHNAEAAECAGFMLLHGDQLYGAQVRRNLPRAKALLLQAARSGRPGAAFMLNMLERTD
jgi:TPR repeat protein